MYLSDLPYQIGASDRFNKALETGELAMDTLNESQNQRKIECRLNTYN